MKATRVGSQEVTRPKAIGEVEVELPKDAPPLETGGEECLNSSEATMVCRATIGRAGTWSAIASRQRTGGVQACAGGTA